MSDIGSVRSFHPDVALKPGRRSLAQIKLMRPDPEALKQKYAACFGT
jgi:hypothetical protein